MVGYGADSYGVKISDNSPFRQGLLGRSASRTRTADAARIYPPIPEAACFHEKRLRDTPELFDPLVRERIEIAKFFKTKTPPVSADETTELFAFLEAAEESKRQNGAVVKLADVLAKAKKK